MHKFEVPFEALGLPRSLPHFHLTLRGADSGDVREVMDRISLESLLYFPMTRLLLFYYFWKSAF